MTDYSNSDENEWNNSPKERPYHKVILPNPEERPYDDWDANERRAYILQKINQEYNLPIKVPRVKMGEKFGVSHTTISRDVDILKGYMSNYLDADFESDVRSIMKSALYELAEDDPYKAVQVGEKLSEWLESRGEVEDNNPDKNEFTGDVEININNVGTRDDVEGEEDSGE